MSKTSTTNEQPKAVKKYAKTRGEHYKDIVIAILVTSIIAFVGGVVFANKQEAEVKSAVSAAQAVVTPVAEAATPAPASK
jgi:Mn2+/Fe2+ NRAMP family transporter